MCAVLQRMPQVNEDGKQEGAEDEALENPGDYSRPG